MSSAPLCEEKQTRLASSASGMNGNFSTADMLEALDGEFSISERLRNLHTVDRLVLRFRRTAPGADFANAWATSRTIRDSGGSTPGEPEPVIPAA